MTDILEAARALGLARVRWAQGFLAYRLSTKTDLSARAMADEQYAIELALAEAEYALAKHELDIGGQPGVVVDSQGEDLKLALWERNIYSRGDLESYGESELLEGQLDAASIGRTGTTPAATTEGTTTHSEADLWHLGISGRPTRGTGVDLSHDPELDVHFGDGT